MGFFDELTKPIRNLLPGTIGYTEKELQQIKYQAEYLNKTNSRKKMNDYLNARDRYEQKKNIGGSVPDWGYYSKNDSNGNNRLNEDTAPLLILGVIGLLILVVKG